MDELIKKDHQARLDASYFNTFNEQKIEKHVSLIQQMEKEKSAFSFTSFSGEEGRTCIEGVALDFSGFFSLVCGVLSLHDVKILKGSHFSYVEAKSARDYPKERSSFLYKRKSVVSLEVESEKEISLSQIETSLQLYVNIYKEKGLSQSRYKLHSKMAQVSGDENQAHALKLAPIDMVLDYDARFTFLKITGKDTPGFLFTLINALNIQGIVVQRIDIDTVQGEVNDRLWLTDRNWKPITQHDRLEKLKSMVALIKQFSGFLPYAPNPDLALKNYYDFLNLFMSNNEERARYLQVDAPEMLTLMAQIFGTGNYLWEEFARMQHENLLPLLQNSRSLDKRRSLKSYQLEIREIIDNHSFDEAIQKMNQFKDGELFRIDLRHLSYTNLTFSEFADQLSDLAESMTQGVLEKCLEKLVQRYELDVEPEDLPITVCALGKFGGRELGFASDLELVFIYTPLDIDWKGKGEQSFYDSLVQLFKKSFSSKRDGIFELDLRLRPHGEAGPLAVSLSRWEAYYGDSSACHDLERNALAKLRVVGGSRVVRRKVEKIRDAILYHGYEPNYDELARLRNVQLESHTKEGILNAKYSSGALVDIEYGVQLLQIKYGATYPEVRNSSTLLVLEALLKKDLISASIFEKLQHAYGFLRRVINALRMVRGNAKDLDLPEKESDDYLFLVRRLGFRRTLKRKNLPEEFENEFNYHRKVVQKFYQNVMEKKDLSSEEGLADLVAGALNEDQSHNILENLGFKDFEKATISLRRLYDLVDDQKTLLSLLVLLGRHLKNVPNPEKVLLRFENMILNAEEQTASYLKKFLNHTHYMQYTVLVFSHSDFFSQVLITQPMLIMDLVEKGELYVKKTQDQFAVEIGKLVQETISYESQLESIRAYQNRELLRILLRDVHARIQMRWITSEISYLTRAVVSWVYDLTFAQAGEGELSKAQVVLAFGKLGGFELNYSSDIDIVFIQTDENLDSEMKTRLQKLDQKFLRALTATSAHGSLFRVDTTLRPYGQQGSLLGSINHYRKYYKEDAGGWEFQIWLKAAPLAGDLIAGQELIHWIRNMAFEAERLPVIKESVRSFRSKVLQILASKDHLYREVKSGKGGIRVIEFWVQALQVEFGKNYPNLVTGNTLEALKVIEDLGLLDGETVRDLTKAYVFMRKVEHRLQFKKMSQEHLLPDSEKELEELAFCCGFHNRVGSSSRDQFFEVYNKYHKVLEKYHDRVYPGLLKEVQ